MSNIPEMEVTHVSVWIRGSLALHQDFNPPVPIELASEWVSQNVTVQFEDRTRIQINPKPAGGE